MNLLEALKTIRDKGPNSTKYGICGNVLDLTDLCTANRLDKLLLKWPENKGRTQNMRLNYPVEGCGADYENSAENGDLWDDPRRHELLNWMIKELEDEANILRNSDNTGDSKPA